MNTSRYRILASFLFMAAAIPTSACTDSGVPPPPSPGSVVDGLGTASTSCTGEWWPFGPSTCEQIALDHCASIGYGGNCYCYLVFSQDCDAGDRLDAVNYCNAHPEIVHATNTDGTCRLIWR